MTKKKREVQCRFTDANGRVCRRPKRHAIHAQHTPKCPVESHMHHDFLTPWRAYGRFAGDPIVRTSIMIRRSQQEYFHQMYGPGGFSVRIRELMADDMGVPESKRRHYVGSAPTMQRDKKGLILGKKVAVDPAAPEGDKTVESLWKVGPDGAAQLVDLNERPGPWDAFYKAVEPEVDDVEEEEEPVV